MRIVRAAAPARVALAGNPSDGFGGQVLALAVDAYRARVTVYEWPRLEIVPGPEDGVAFDSVDDLGRDVAANGYYGGLRLVKATVKRLADRLAEEGASIGRQTFSVRYETDIPRGVGLGGSSAIVIATIAAVLEFTGAELEPREVPGLALAVETEELGIAAGLQDRIAQARGGLTLMDFTRGPYVADAVDPAGLPGLYVAHLAEAAEPSDVFHRELRRKADLADGDFRDHVSELAASAARAAHAAANADHAGLAAELTATFEARSRLAPLDPRHVELVEIARRHGSAANFTGSGGAVVGVWRDDAHRDELSRAFAAAGCSLRTCTAAAGAFPNEVYRAGRDGAGHAPGSPPGPGPGSAP